jgi:GntR family transcriptional regulator of arabinose operon
MDSIANTALPITDTRARQSRSSQGAEIIKQRIKQGVYKPGEKLPSLRSLSSELNLSFPAVQRAVRQLEKEAILESRHGVGIRILDSADCNGTPLLFGFVQPYFSRFSLALQHYLEQALDSRSNLCVVKSTHNEPERERTEIERLIASGINGLLVWPVDGDTNGEFLQTVSQRLPVVFVDRTLEGIRSAAVVLDYESGGRQIIRGLHQKGYQRLLVVCDPIDISSFRQLKAGLREEASLLGLNECVTVFDYPVLSKRLFNG